MSDIRYQILDFQIEGLFFKAIIYNMNELE